MAFVDTGVAPNDTAPGVVPGSSAASAFAVAWIEARSEPMPALELAAGVAGIVDGAALGLGVAPAVGLFVAPAGVARAGTSAAGMLARATGASAAG
ncbi:MAG: hypothetical protein ACRDHX_16455 [Chloroflexota bacterium]